MEAIKEFYAKMEAVEASEGGMDPEAAERKRKVELATRLHDEFNLNWEQAADAAGVALATLKVWRKKAIKCNEKGGKPAKNDQPPKCDASAAAS